MQRKASPPVRLSLSPGARPLPGKNASLVPSFSAFLRLSSLTTALLMVCAYFVSVSQLSVFSPPAVDRWLNDRRTTGELILRRGLRARHCFVVAMVLASESDVKNGSMSDWWKTVPPYREASTRSGIGGVDGVADRVCCVYIRRSQDVRLRFEYAENGAGCDTMFVPMVRPDEYLTISEKVVLALRHINAMYKFDWLLKTDTDSFVCFARLLELVCNFDPTGIVHLGYAESRNVLLEDPLHRWYDPSMTDIVHNGRQHVVSGVGLYHPYMQGAGYVLSAGAVAHLERLLPHLRYSPMEDAMLGSWMLALNTHYGVLDLDLRAQRAKCHMPAHLVISHERKGRAAFDECRAAHPECMQPTDSLRARREGLDRVSFVVTGDFSQRANQCMDGYGAIRAMFPRAEVVFGDVSTEGDVLHRLVRTARDPRLSGVRVASGSRAAARNRAVATTTGEFVVILRDVQRMSWETMVGRMVEHVQAGTADVAGGFLKFNPHMNQSANGVFSNGFRVRVSGGTAWKEDVRVERWRTPNETAGVDATSGFLLARREFLMKHKWRDYGLFTEDEWHLRVRGSGARLVVVNSGVRHGYHYTIEEDTGGSKMVGQSAKRVCKALGDGAAGRAGPLWAVAGRHGRLDCMKRMWRSQVGNVTRYTRW